jgi:hypothetical protein
MCNALKLRRKIFSGSVKISKNIVTSQESYVDLLTTTISILINSGFYFTPNNLKHNWILEGNISNLRIQHLQNFSVKNLNDNL